VIVDWHGFDTYSLHQKSGQNRLVFVLMSKTNPIALQKNQNDRISPTPTKSDRPFQQNKRDHLPNQPQRDRISAASRKAIANFSKTARSREKESATGLHR
jgi:hypothetical protein